MKYFFVLFIISIIYSCSDQDEFNPNDIEKTFILQTINGEIKNEFKSDEEFLVNFNIINKSNSKLNFTSALPIISFSVITEDSVICTSRDYLTYAAGMLDGEINEGDSYEASWIGPNTGGRKSEDKNIVLKPGMYKIKVFHSSFFKEYKLPETEMIDFEIVE